MSADELDPSAGPVKRPAPPSPEALAYLKRIGHGELADDIACMVELDELDAELDAGLADE